MNLDSQVQVGEAEDRHPLRLLHITTIALGSLATLPLELQCVATCQACGSNGYPLSHFNAGLELAAEAESVALEKYLFRFVLHLSAIWKKLSGLVSHQHVELRPLDDRDW